MSGKSEILSNIFTWRMDRPISAVRFCCTVAVASVVFAGQAWAGAITFSDGTFTPGDWFGVEVASVDSNLALQAQSGLGNPAPSRYTAVTISGPGGFYYRGNFTVVALVDPASLPGQITKLDFAWDARSNEDDGVDGFLSQICPAIFQNGTAYGGNFDSVFTDWNASSFVGWVEDDFGDIVSAAPPDLSPTGAPFYLGYMNIFQSSAVAQLEQRVDNWSATVHYVPEPYSAMLAGVGVAMVVAVGLWKKGLAVRRSEP